MQTELPVLKGIYFGSRGDDFKRLIDSLLKKGKVKQRHINLLLSEDNLSMYSDAFTSELVDERHNYQVYEQVGDLSANKFIASYFYRRFPQLKCAEGVKVVARLRINYGSKQTFFQIAEKLGFWQFITAPHDVRQRKMKSLLEDVFEAVLGVTETILDEQVGTGVGYAWVYRILRGIFNEMDISLKYDDLYDANTRIKELFDVLESKIGKLTYKTTKVDLLNYCTAFRVDATGNHIKLGKGTAALVQDAQQKASKQALEVLARQGWKKDVPVIYEQFASGKVVNPLTTEAQVIKVCKGVINSQVPTKNKNKYNNLYTSTALSFYCRKRDLEGVKICMRLQADVNMLDSEGMSPLDQLMIGKRDKEYEAILELLLKASSTLLVHKDVLTAYKHVEHHQFKYM